MKSQSTFERVNFLKRTEAELMRLFERMEPSIAGHVKSI